MSVYKKNNKWYCKFQIEGERKHLLCAGAKTEKEAEKIETGFKYKLMQEINGVAPKKLKKVKMAVLLALYDDYSRVNKLSHGRDAFVKYIGEYFGKNTFANDITPKKIDKFKEWLKKEHNNSNSTVNKYRAALSKMFSLAIANKLLCSNPVSDTASLRETNHKVRYLTKDEEERMFKVIDELYPYLRPIVMLALKTGMRKGEIFKLKWENIDFNYKYIEILETKSGKSRKIPISKTVENILSGHNMDTEYVFVNPATNKPFTDIKHSFHTVLKKAEISNFRFHDLRHTAATRMSECGVPVPVIQDILGHSRIETTMRYTHTITKTKTTAIELLDKY